VKTHISLQTSDLGASVAFYKTLLQQEPAKYYGDYAFFVADDPQLELAINHVSEIISSDDVHYGIAVDNAQSVEAAVARLRAGRYRTDIEIEETCCYAKQTKVWTRDPDGRRWEVYTVHEETGQRDDPNGTCCTGAV